MIAGAVQALEVPGGGLLAILGTFLLAWLFYAVTLHLAATFFVGDVPTQPAAAAALGPAAAGLLLVQFPPAVVAAVTLAVDAVAVRWAYALAPVGVAALTLLHFAFATVLGVAVLNLLGLA